MAIDVHAAVFKAVKEGILTRPKICSNCKRPSNRIEGHHHDHSKPLDVIWLCRKCHKNTHMRNSKVINIDEVYDTLVQFKVSKDFGNRFQRMCIYTGDNVASLLRGHMEKLLKDYESKEIQYKKM